MALVSLLLACDGGKEPKKTAEAKTPAETKTPAEAKAGDAKPAEAKAGDAKAPGAKAGDAKLHLDVSKDKSGVLARSATVIEVSRAHDDEVLRALSHHAEALPSVEELCKHEAEVGKTGVAVPDCVKAMEHHVVRLGPELYAEVATCIMAAKTPEAVEACEAAELEAEKRLHDQPHGDGLTAEVCETLFGHFEALAMEDAGEHAKLVEEVLEEVKPDVVTACQEQGTQAEIDCAMKAKAMAELQACDSALL